MPQYFPGIALMFVMCAAAAGGAFVRRRLPEEHRTRESMELVQLTITLLVTFTSIVLGLLTGSVKQGFDAAYQTRGTYAAQLTQMDQCLRDYGPETDGMREQLRQYVAAVIASTWPDEPAPKIAFPSVKDIPETGESPQLGLILDRVRTDVRRLDPRSAVQTRVLSDCMNQFSDLEKSRWSVIEGAKQSIATPFYWVLGLWLTILFASFGLTAPPNFITILIVILTALSITIAVGVIADLDQPYGGIFGIPSTSMRNALADMMR